MLSSLNRFNFVGRKTSQTNKMWPLSANLKMCFYSKQLNFFFKWMLSASWHSGIICLVEWKNIAIQIYNAAQMCWNTLIRACRFFSVLWHISWQCVKFLLFLLHWEHFCWHQVLLRVSKFPMIQKFTELSWIKISSLIKSSSLQTAGY